MTRQNEREKSKVSQLWYVVRDRAEQGPFNNSTLFAMSKDGRLKPTDKVRRDIDAEAMPALRIRGLSFPGNHEELRVADCYRVLSKRVTEIIVNMSSSKHHDRFSRRLKKTRIPEYLSELLLSPEAELVHQAVSLSIGCDVVFWGLKAIISDGQIDEQEMDMIAPVACDVARCFARYSDSFAAFASMQQGDVSAFLAEFKRDRGPLGYAAVSHGLSTSPFALPGGTIAALIYEFAPDSNSFRMYQRLIETLVAAILKVDGVTPVEQAVFESAKSACAAILQACESLKTADVTHHQTLLEDIPSKPQTSAVILVEPRQADFRNVSWGMSRNDVQRLESAKFSSETPVGLLYEVSVAGLQSLLYYIFAGDMLVRAKYLVTERHSNLNDFLNDFKKLKSLLREKYGDNGSGSGYERDVIWMNDLFRHDVSEWGLAVSIGHAAYYSSWEVSGTTITLFLSGDNHSIDLGVEYLSLAHQDLEDKLRKQKHLSDL